MPGAEHGFSRSIDEMISGFVLLAIVGSVLASTFGESGKNLLVLINSLFMVTGLVQLEKAKHWGIGYTAGYLFGLVVLGNYLMETWELLIYSIVIGAYLQIR